MKSETGSLALSPIILGQMPFHAQRVLDVGCGNGKLTAVLAKKASSVLAIDIDDLAIAKANSEFSGRENLIFHVGNAEHLDESIDDLMFDCIVSVFTLHHLNLSRSLESMKRHLTRNGKIIIVDFFADRKRSFASLLLDQILFSHLREIPVLLHTARDIGIVNILRFLSWRLKLAASPEARLHMRQDYSQDLPPSIAQWRHCLQAIIPDGLERVLMGSVFMYSWDNR